MHRAAVVLAALDEAGICRLSELPEPPLSLEERHALDDVQSWLNELLTMGLGQLSPALLERGHTLAVRVRQDDFPRLSGLLVRLIELQQQELAGQAAVRTADIRERLMDIAILLRALKKTPFPRPRHELAGVHRRDFFAVQDLALNCISVEAWNSARGMSGLSLHFCDAQQKQWYRYNVTHPTMSEQMISPEKTLAEERLGGQILAHLEEKKIHLKQGWVSADGALSGRKETHLEIDGDMAVELISEWNTLRERMFQQLEQRPLDRAPRQLVVITPADCEPAHFDPVEQIWQQTVYDTGSPRNRLKLHKTNPSTAWLKQMKLGVQAHDRVFGLLSLEGTELNLQPLSLKSGTAKQTLHLSFTDTATYYAQSVRNSRLWAAIQCALDKSLMNGLFQIQPSNLSFFCELKETAERVGISTLAKTVAPLADSCSTIDNRIEAWQKMAGLDRAIYTIEMLALKKQNRFWESA